MMLFLFAKSEVKVEMKQQIDGKNIGNSGWSGKRAKSRGKEGTGESELKIYT
jgi:hypothetical protein